MEIEKDKFNRVVHRLIELAKEREHTILQSEIDETWSSIEHDADMTLGLRKRRKTMFFYGSVAAAAVVAVAILLFNSIMFATDEARDLMEYVATG